MKKLFLLIILLYTTSYLRAQSLSGKVTDSATHLSIPGAVVYIPQLKLGATADVDGHYKIDVPNGQYDVQAQDLGYATVLKHIKIAGKTALDFTLSESSSNMQDVVITGLGNQTTILRSPVPVALVSHEMLLQGTGTNVIDAIAEIPGMSEVTTGPGTSKPEINGLGFNRVLTIFDGERQEDFQWGDEHGILIDPYAVYNAEIIKGPASLQYGANATAGVVSFKSEPFAEKGAVQGSVQSEYQTNNGLIGNTVDLSGNHNGFVWDARVSNEDAHCYTDPKDGYVWSTAYAQANGRAVIGINKKWGYSHLSASFLKRRVEVPDGNRDSATGQFEFDVPLHAQYTATGAYVPGTGQIYPTRSDFHSYNTDIAPYQILQHNEVWLQNSFNVGAGTLGVDIGYTISIRQEIDTGNAGEENMRVHDIPYVVKYQIEGLNSGIKLTTGINGMYEFEKNFSEPAPPYVGDYEIPNYHLFDAGAFGIAEKDIKDLTLSGGLRYDVRTITGQAMYLSNYATPAQEQVPAGTPGAYMQFPAFSNSYTGLSGSIGASYQLPDRNYIKLNISKSYRAPAINELTSNELDPANIFKIGNPNLKPEQGFQADLAYGNTGRDVSFEVDGFYNHINNFIFADRLGSANGGDSMRLGAPAYIYTANTAIITGVNAFFNIHPITAKWLEVNNGFSYAYSFLPGQTDSTRHIPFTPAPRLTSDVKFKLADRPHSILKGTYIKIGLAKYWAQNNIYSALWTELPSDPYILYNTGAGTNFVNRKTKRILCSLVLNCTNLLNLAYVDHNSREQYFWAYNSVSNPTNFGAQAAVVTRQSEGIYNMGRNAGIKLLWPIGGHKVSETELHGVE